MSPSSSPSSSSSNSPPSRSPSSQESYDNSHVEFLRPKPTEDSPNYKSGDSFDSPSPSEGMFFSSKNEEKVGSGPEKCSEDGDPHVLVKELSSEPKQLPQKKKKKKVPLKERDMNVPRCVLWLWQT